MRVITLHLRRAYRQSGLTYEQIAERAGVGDNTVDRVLSGRNATIGSVCAVAQALGVSSLPLTPTDGTDTPAA
jgi:transcriptional regulator with XRE-family HTH domain